MGLGQDNRPQLDVCCRQPAERGTSTGNSPPRDSQDAARLLSQFFHLLTPQLKTLQSFKKKNMYEHGNHRGASRVLLIFVSVRMDT